MPAPIEKSPETPIVTERAEEANALTIERKEVVTPSKVKFSGQVYSDTGEPLITTPENKEVTVVLPADPAVIQAKAAGNPDDSVTWFHAFWKRVLLQAILMGKKLVVAKT